MTHSTLLLLAGLALGACGQGRDPAGDSALPANVAEKASDHCAQPTLTMVDSTRLQSTLMDETRRNFASAFKKACDKGFLAGKPLIDPKAADQGRLFMINAPEANVASIYLSDVDGNRMVLEYPFLTTDGKTQMPSAAELEEAIYCAAVGATPEEQESTGRCLVD